MQPHSMCAIAIASYIWNDPAHAATTWAEMRVEYKKDNSYKINIYRLSDIYQSPDGKEIVVSIVRSGGGLSCRVTLRRRSASEGSTVETSHATIHKKSLAEEFSLYKRSITNGRHRNSDQYRDFKGEIRYDRHIVLQCEVKNSDNQFSIREYDLKISNIG